MNRVDAAVAWTFRLLPAAALLPALVVVDGPLRWIGLFGLIPLLLAFRKDCPACALRAAAERPAWSPWPGH